MSSYTFFSTRLFSTLSRSTFRRGKCTIRVPIMLRVSLSFKKKLRPVKIYPNKNTILFGNQDPLTKQEPDNESALAHIMRGY